MRRVHHMQGGADDVTGLLTAALTASIHGSIEGKADAAGLLLWPTSEPHCATAACGLLLCPICMHRVHHIQGGADDVTGLLTAALTA